MQVKMQNAKVKVEPTISLIVALDEGQGIGKEGRIPWHISDDLKRFRRITSGHAVIMGRKTFESIGRPLPDRINIVVTRQSDFSASGIKVADSPAAALALAREIESAEIFVIGGGEIYRTFLPLADRLYLTVVEGLYEADAFFPEYESQFGQVESEEAHPGHDPSYRYLTLRRGNKPSNQARFPA